MADERPPFTLTVRQSEHDSDRYEFVVSRQGHEAVRSGVSFEMPELAKEAGEQRGRELTEGGSSNDLGRN